MHDTRGRHSEAGSKDNPKVAPMERKREGHGDESDDKDLRRSARAGRAEGEKGGRVLVLRPLLFPSIFPQPGNSRYQFSIFRDKRLGESKEFGVYRPVRKGSSSLSTHFFYCPATLQ